MVARESDNGNIMDEKRVAPLLRELTQEEVISFFNAHGVAPTCPACGNAESSIHVRTNGSVTGMGTPGILFNNSTGIAGIEMHRPSVTIATECDNCGLYRNFSYLKIMNWADKRGRKE